jgi:hypothetical protein
MQSHALPKDTSTPRLLEAVFFPELFFFSRDTLRKGPNKSTSYGLYHLLYTQNQSILHESDSSSHQEKLWSKATKTALSLGLLLSDPDLETHDDDEADEAEPLAEPPPKLRTRSEGAKVLRSILVQKGGWLVLDLFLFFWDQFLFTILRNMMMMMMMLMPARDAT